MARTFEEYCRSYVNDPSSVATPGTPVVPATESETVLTNYIRSYLNDPLVVEH